RVAAGNRKGWVDRRFLKPVDSSVDLAPKAFSRIKHGDHSPCKTTLKDCLPVGCATGDSEEEKRHALFNTTKHGPGSGPVAPLTLAAFATLQKKAGDLVGEGAELSEEDRHSIASLVIGGVPTGEGHLARVTGFIVGTPHPNTG